MSRALGALLFSLLVAQTAAHAADKLRPGEVTIRIVDPANPALIFTNASRGEAKTVRYWTVLWNLDGPLDAGPLPIPEGGLRRLIRDETSAPLHLFEAPEVRSSLKRGNRIVGSIAIDCQNCARIHSYRVFVIYGEGGWFADVADVSNGAVLDRGDYGLGAGLKDALLAWANEATDVTRMPIAPATK